jgi:hypothetical protein
MHLPTGNEKEAAYNEWLVVRCQQGDKEAFEDLIRRWEARLFYYRRLPVELHVVVDDGKELGLSFRRFGHAFLFDSGTGVAAIDLNASRGFAYASAENGMSLSLKPTSCGAMSSSIRYIVAW